MHSLSLLVHTSPPSVHITHHDSRCQMTKILLAVLLVVLLVLLSVLLLVVLLAVLLVVLLVVGLS